MASSLVLENVTVSYPIQKVGAAPRSGIARALAPGKLGGTSVDVLRNVWIDLRDGDRLAIIGRNGAGKSTLLRTMAGIYAPTTGRIWREGVVAPIFSASVGFIPQSSGYENIFLRGMLLGLSRQQITERVDDILAFADIGDWIHQPVQTYSSGMALRLAFAITTSIDPNILLLDEWIGAGDALFTQRARARLKVLVENANILAVTSHRDALVRQFCNRAIILDKGGIIFHGEVDDAFLFYRKLVEQQREADKDVQKARERAEADASA